MQTSFIQSHEKQSPIPTILVKTLNEEQIAIRFKQIGPSYRFKIILQRFRFDFPLAVCQEIDTEAWWIILSTQNLLLSDFATRNGLKVKEED